MSPLFIHNKNLKCDCDLVINREVEEHSSTKKKKKKKEPKEYLGLSHYPFLST